MLQKAIEKKLSSYLDVYVNKTYAETKAVSAVSITEDEVRIAIQLGYPCTLAYPQLISALKAEVEPLAAGKEVKVDITSRIEAHSGKPGIKGLANIKNIVVVGSGKGGVGKSTVAVNIALALARDGAQVGLLDADIYGPSQPAMLGAQGERPILNQQRLTPIRRHGIQSMSIGYLIDQTAPMIWRGPMLGKALQQLLQDTDWESLDYLIIDLPPGTGDVQLTLCQKMPITGALIVTTPQDIALLDVKRACEMFKKLQVPILGVIENMSVHRCPNCGFDQHIFGEGGGAALAEAYALPLLGEIPLVPQIREMTDSGTPPTVQETPFANVFFDIARKTAAALSQYPKDYSGLFPKISVASGASIASPVIPDQVRDERPPRSGG